MEMSRKTISRTIAVLLVTILVLTIALASVLFTLDKGGHWSVVTDLGLELYDSTNSTVVTDLTFSVARYGSVLRL